MSAPIAVKGQLLPYYTVAVAMLSAYQKVIKYEDTEAHFVPEVLNALLLHHCSAACIYILLVISAAF